MTFSEFKSRMESAFPELTFEASFQCSSLFLEVKDKEKCLGTFELLDNDIVSHEQLEEAKKDIQSMLA